MACGPSSGQPLTAPAVRPATMRRWKNSTAMMMGMVTMMAAAAIEPVGVWNCEAPVNDEIAGGTVWAPSGVEVSDTAKTKSFQAKMKTRIAVVNTPGAASGAMTLRKACIGVA